MVERRARARTRRSRRRARAADPVARRERLHELVGKRRPCRTCGPPVARPPASRSAEVHRRGAAPAAARADVARSSRRRWVTRPRRQASSRWLHSRGAPRAAARGAQSAGCGAARSPRSSRRGGGQAADRGRRGSHSASVIRSSPVSTRPRCCRARSTGSRSVRSPAMCTNVGSRARRGTRHRRGDPHRGGSARRRPTTTGAVRGGAAGRAAPSAACRRRTHPRGGASSSDDVAGVEQPLEVVALVVAVRAHRGRLRQRPVVDDRALQSVLAAVEQLAEDVGRVGPGVAEVGEQLAAADHGAERLPDGDELRRSVRRTRSG